MLRSLQLLLDTRQRRRIFLVLLGTLLAALLEMVGIGAIPAFVGLLSNRDRLLSMLPPGTFQNWAQSMDGGRLVLLSATALAFAFLLKNGFLAFLIYAESGVVRDITVSTSNRLFRAYVYSPYTFHLQRNPAQLINTINEEAGSVVEIIARAFMLIRESLVLVVLLVLLLLVDPLVSLAVFLALGGIATTFYMMVRRSLLQRGDLAQTHRARRMQVINQALGAVKDAKLMGREPWLIDQVHAETSAVEAQELYRRGLILMPRLFLEVLAVSAILLVAVLYVVLGRPPETMLPVLALLAVSVVRLVPAFNTISSSLVDMRFMTPGWHTTVRELSQLEPAAEAHAKTTLSEASQLSELISLVGVTYRYPNAARDSLNGVSLSISAGEAVAFVGPSGAGKSTLIDVILGLLTPATGVVLVDGADIQKDLRGWQGQIGYIPQDIYLLDDTIRRNVAFALPDEDISDVAVMRALAAAQLADFVANLPAGLDTTIGNRGVRLSGGERQRLGIARALYHDPAVLVMDEATSALDNETERGIIEAVTALRGDRTIIMIAHRLTTVQECDRLFLLSAGELLDVGTYPELVARHESLRIPEVAAGAADQRSELP